MQVTVSARHGHLDDPTQKQLQEKAEKLLTFFDRLTSIGVTVDLHKDRADKVRVEITARAEHKHEFVAREGAADLMAALDLALDKIVHQIHRYKEKIQDHRRNVSTGQGAQGPVEGAE